MYKYDKQIVFVFSKQQYKYTLTDNFSNNLPVVVFVMSSSNSSDNFRWNHLRTRFAFRSSKNKN